MTKLSRAFLASAFGALWLFGLSLHAASLPLLDPPKPTEVGPRAVPTFACLSLYWSPPEGTGANTCQVQYRESGAAEWRKALDLWFDPRNGEYRGSVVGLRAGVSYEVALRLVTSGTSAALFARTWSEVFPIARTIVVKSGAAPYHIKEGGSPGGYVLYTAPEGEEAVIDVAGGAPSCVVVEASHVIVRGLTLRGAGQTSVQLHGPVHDVVVERCDISGWGRIASDGWGRNLDAGVGADSSAIERIVVQRNRIHDPRSNANDWGQPRTITGEKSPNHPNGPQGIVFVNCKGNNVLRYNEVYGDETHRFNDGLGGNENFSFEGYPGPDSDVYGNIVRNACDDGLEIEGGGRNVRIWGNYIDHTAVGVASAAVSIGPLYIFRNVYGVSRWHGDDAADSTNHGVFGKIANSNGYGGGRRYFFHNTILQPVSPTGDATAGAGEGAGDSAGPMTNTISRNNIFHVNTNVTLMAIWKASSWSVSGRAKSNDFDYDLCNGEINLAEGQEAHAARGIPIYAPGNGPDAFPQSGGPIRPTGKYALAPTSPGYNQGEPIPNFNDGFKGSAPDMGAQEADSPPMEFGVHAYESD